MAAVYVPRSPTTGVFYGVVRTHLSELLAAVDAQTDGAGLPGFVVNEFRKFLRCGVLAQSTFTRSCSTASSCASRTAHCASNPAAPPTDDDVRRVVARVRRRLEALGIAVVTVADHDADPLADESPALASLSRAATLGRTALGRHTGRGPLRLGADPDAP